RNMRVKAYSTSSPVLLQQEVREEIGIPAVGGGAPGHEGEGARRRAGGQGTGHEPRALEDPGLERDLRKEGDAKPALHHLQEGGEARGLHAGLQTAAAGTAGRDRMVAEAMALLEQQHVPRVDAAEGHVLLAYRGIGLAGHEGELVLEELAHVEVA